MKLRIIKLGTNNVTDSATGLEGIVTHLNIVGSADSPTKLYAFQPKGLDKETCKPVMATWLTEDRITGLKETDHEERDIPLNILGSKVSDTGSGYTGTATGLVLYQDGCVHVEVQAKGLTPKGRQIEAAEFNILRLEGKEIPKLTAEEVKTVQKKTPSPCAVTPTRLSRPV